MKYGALTFDTQVVMSNGFDFDGGYLKQLKTLKHDEIHVVVSEIVKSEITKHLAHKTKEAKDRLDSAIKKAQDLEIITLATPPTTDKDQIRKLATKRLSRFLADLNAITIPIGDLLVSEIMRRYFAATPPFSAGAKKDEFPDSVTLLSIEAWAKKQDVRVLAISGDADWKAFSETSEYLDVVSSISDALATIKVQSVEARIIAGSLLDRIDSTEEDPLKDELFNRVRHELESISVFPEANSYYHLEPGWTEIHLEDYKIRGLEHFKLISSADDLSEIVVEVDLCAEVEAHASFSVSHYDSVDGDYVSLGGTSASRDLDLDLEVLITFERSGETWEILEVEMTKFPATIDFGEVEPDYGNDYYDT